MMNNMLNGWEHCELMNATKIKHAVNNVSEENRSTHEKEPLVCPRK